MLTSYREYLPENPTLPPPPSFLESRSDTVPSGTHGLAEVLRTAPELTTQVPRALSDTALLQYTSGTTGTPKAAEITHGNLVSNCELQRVYRGSSESDVSLGVLPWFHITGMECQMNMMAYMGGTIVAIGRFDLATVLRAIELYRCTVTTLITTVNVAIVNSPKTKEVDLSSLRLCFSGGAPVPAEIARRWERIVDWCRANMAAYKSPRQVRFLEALPKTASGKVLKRILRDQARVRSGQTSADRV